MFWIALIGLIMFLAWMCNDDDLPPPTGTA